MTVRLNIKDEYSKEFFQAVGTLPKDAFCEDPLEAELQKRVDEIDSKKAKLIPFEDGMNSIIEKIKAKHEKNYIN
ncbi:MAG: hypothetical protein HXX81_01415 [Campylobacterales bacterium]|nr:hypothetical protein [Campylobacterales bacterium]